LTDPTLRGTMLIVVNVAKPLLNSPSLPETGRANFNQLYPFRHGLAQLLLANRNDNVLTPLIAAYAEFSETEVDVFRELIRPDDVVIEVGANIGAHTLALSELVPRGKVYCFEPQRLTYYTLCANLALNSVVNVHAERAIVGASCGASQLAEMDPHVACNFGCFKASLESPNGEFTPIMTLDALALPRVDFIKLDCEGAELDVLRGATEIISSFRPAVYMEFDDNRQELIEYFSPLGYSLARHFPNHANKACFGGVGYSVASDMVLAWPAGRPCGAAMANGAFTRGMGFVPATADQALRKP
jgi:FkbM family methyltransferase